MRLRTKAIVGGAVSAAAAFGLQKDFYDGPTPEGRATCIKDSGTVALNGIDVCKVTEVSVTPRSVIEGEDYAVMVFQSALAGLVVAAAIGIRGVVTSDPNRNSSLPLASPTIPH